MAMRLRYVFSQVLSFSSRTRYMHAIILSNVPFSRKAHANSANINWKTYDIFTFSLSNPLSLFLLDTIRIFRYIYVWISKVLRKNVHTNAKRIFAR